MTIKELITELQDHDENAQMRIALQQSHPLWAHIDGVNTTPRNNDDYEDDDPQRKMVFIVADDPDGYTTSELWG